MSEDLYFMGHKSSNISSDGHGDDISVAVLPLLPSPLLDDTDPHLPMS